MKISTILEKAAERLDTHGWRQGLNGEIPGPNCALGAIRLLETGDPYGTDSDAAMFANRWLCEHANVVVTTFNDTISRTKEEVQDVLIALAAEAREQGK